jgi:hypothetical protein
VRLELCSWKRGLVVSWFSRAHGPTVGQVLHGSGVSRDGPRTTVVSGSVGVEVVIGRAAGRAACGSPPGHNPIADFRWFYAA